MSNVSTGYKGLVDNDRPSPSVGSGVGRAVVPILGLWRAPDVRRTTSHSEYAEVSEVTAPETAHMTRSEPARLWGLRIALSTEPRL